MMEYVKLERIWLKNRSDLDEKWVQDRISEDPSILGLGKDDIENHGDKLKKLMRLAYERNPL